MARIREIFLERDAEQILQIPISTTGLRDRKIWGRTNHSNFTVKTGDVIAKEIITSHSTNGVDIGQNSGVGTDADKRRRVWNIKAPMKVRIFIWKCLHQIVPVNEVLHRRTMPVESYVSYMRFGT